MIINIGIVIAFFTFILLVLLSSLMITIYFLGKRSVKNDPNKALILVKNGLNVYPIKGNQTEITKKGVCYRYKKDKFVFMPKQYSEVFLNCRRLIFLSRIGQLIASPFANDIPLTEEENSNLIYEMCSTHIGADAMKALKGKGNAGIILIAIIAFVIGMSIVVIFNQVSASRQQLQQSQQSQQSPTIIKEQ